MRIEKKAITDVELDYDYVMSDLEQRELIRWFFQNKPDMIREIICDECPEHIGHPGCIGSIRQPILQEDAYLIERVNAGMGEWEYVIQYCGEYYATAASEAIARDIVMRARHYCPDCTDYQAYCENKFERGK